MAKQKRKKLIIRRRIKMKRAEYKRKRKKKILRLKHTGRLESMVKGLKWWKRLWIAIVIGLKRIYRTSNTSNTYGSRQKSNKKTVE